MQRKITITNAAILLQVDIRKLKKLAETGEVYGEKNSKGFWRFCFEDLAAYKPALHIHKSRLTSVYVRPKRLVFVRLNHAKGYVVLYLRNAKEVLNLCAGLDAELSGILSRMIDVLATHDNQGIPVEPPSYAPGILGVGQRKWTQTYLPKLLGTRKIKRVKRHGIEVYVLADPELMEGPRAVVRLVTDEQLAAIDRILNDKSGWKQHFWPDSPPIIQRDPRPEVRIGRMPDEESNVAPVDDELRETVDAMIRDKIWDRSNDPVDMKPVEPPAEPKPVKAKLISDELVAVQPELVPKPVVYDVLKQAGIDVDGHPSGEFFWYRQEHQEVLDKWLRTVPVNEVVARISRAVQAGRFQDHANNLEIFTDTVLER